MASAQARGVADRLKELPDVINDGNVADKASGPERFASLRAVGYWRLRERFEHGQIIISDDDDLINELTSLKDKIVKSNGQIRLEKKEKMKQRLRKSPDLAASRCLAFLEPPQGPDVVIEFILSTTKKGVTGGTRRREFVLRGCYTGVHDTTEEAAVGEGVEMAQWRQ